MTKAKFFKKNMLITGFEISGHTGYATHGEDILCAAVSAVSQSTCLGVMQILNLKAKMKKNDDKGFLSLDLKHLSIEEIKNAQTLLITLEKTLKDISIGNEKFIKVEENHEIY